jgi:hypothetical protein
VQVVRIEKPRGCVMSGVCTCYRWTDMVHFVLVPPLAAYEEWCVNGTARLARTTSPTVWHDTSYVPAVCGPVSH